MLLASPAFAANTPPEISSFTSSTLTIITIVATAAAALFLIKGGYSYITSTGKPEALEEAKKTIRNALIGLVLVLAANVLISIFQNALTPGTTSGNIASINLAPLNTATPTGSFVQVLIDAVTGFMENLVASSVVPMVNGVMSFLGTTPSLLANSVVVRFWLISLGIVDSLFVLVTALLGLQLMSASTFGFEELEFKHVLPRIGLAFLGANVSLFLADYAITACNALVTAVLNASGGLSEAWVLAAVNPVTMVTGNTPLIILVFLVLFLIISIVLLLMYISRLIVISLGAVLSPFVFLLWTIPKFSDFAEVAIKGYLVSVFTIFIHVVAIQLASAFLTIPGNSNNSLLSIAIAIGLFCTLLKVPSFMMEMVLFTSRNGAFRKVGRELSNVMTADKSSSDTRAETNRKIKTPRKEVDA